MSENFEAGYDEEVEAYLNQLKECPECGKKIKYKDWPVMPSNGKPKRTCCLTTGWNQRAKLKDRKRTRAGQEEYKCLSCNTYKTEDGFYKNRGRFQYRCKQCHKEKYKNYQSPSAIKAKAQSKLRKIKKENKLIQCAGVWFH